MNNIKLVYVGPDGGYREVLEKHVLDLNLKNKVIFTGTVSDSEKNEAFTDADIFVTPSFYGFPITFVEACAYGLPIITTDKGDKLEWIHNKVGYVVKYDKDQLSASISRVLESEDLRRKFGAEGRKLVEEKFNWGEIVKTLEEIYSNVLIDNDIKKGSL